MSSSQKSSSDSSTVNELSCVKTSSSPLSSSPQNSLVLPKSNQLQNSHDRPLAEVIGESFLAFDHETAVVRPFAQETSRDVSFEQELSTMLLDVILETHAWAAARPKHESHAAVQKFEKKISEVMEVEKEQDRTREGLNEFVTRMKTALAALTGLGL